MNENGLAIPPVPRARGGARPATGATRRAVLVTGMSGAGKTSALKALEDLGYEAVDNVPISLMPSLVAPAERRIEEVGGGRPVAVGIDIRTRDFAVDAVVEGLDRLAAEGDVAVRVLFLDCDDDEIRRRFTETRRRHPLAVDRPVGDGIAHERRLVSPLRARADVVIDTTALAAADVKRILSGHFGLEAGRGLAVFVTSFSYRLGLPREADLVFDVRFLANPHYEPALKGLSGRDPEVAEFIAADAGFVRFFDGLTALLGPLLPRFAAEGKSYLTLAVGCTGGRHRSVFVAERLATWLGEQGEDVQLRHRDLDRAGT